MCCCGRWWWWSSLSVPAKWREQIAFGQPYHQPEQMKLLTAPFDARSPSTDYCGMFERLSDAPTMYSCKICGKKVTNRWHHSAIHRPQVNRCPQCQQCFTRKDNMKAHIRLKHSGPIFPFDLFCDRNVNLDMNKDYWRITVIFFLKPIYALSRGNTFFSVLPILFMFFT